MIRSSANQMQTKLEKMSKIKLKKKKVFDKMGPKEHVSFIGQGEKKIEVDIRIPPFSHFVYFKGVSTQNRK